MALNRRVQRLVADHQIVVLFSPKPESLVEVDSPSIPPRPRLLLVLRATLDGLFRPYSPLRLPIIRAGPKPVFLLERYCLLERLKIIGLLLRLTKIVLYELYGIDRGRV